MDLFAAILVSITAITICGICLFIFVCAFQPRFLRKLHGKATRVHQDSDASSHNNEDNLSAKSLDLASVSTSAPTIDRDKKAYLLALERSIRTGQRIQAADDEDPPNETKSRFNPLNFISRFINKYIRRRTADGHSYP